MPFGFKICIASDSSGVITQNSKVIIGTVLKRTVKWNEKEYVDETITTENGEFSFPVIIERSLFKHFPIQPVISQEVSISYKGEIHNAWELMKMDWNYLGEINSGKTIIKKAAKPFIVSCELTDSEYSRYAPNSLRSIHGKCLLKGEARPPAKSN